jgi:hypothetical protein
MDNPGGDDEKMMRHSLIALLLIAVILLAGCGGDEGSKKTSATATPAVPDLAVTNVELSPAQIGVGQSFTIKVYVTNLGGAASGSYGLTINLRDVTRGTTSPIGTQQGQSIAPGAEVLAFETGQRQISQAGSYQVQVALAPAGTDGDAGNNGKDKAFSVQ